MKKAVLTFICSMILMGAIGATFPENAEPAMEQTSYVHLSNYDSDSMPKLFYVV